MNDDWLQGYAYGSYMVIATFLPVSVTAAVLYYGGEQVMRGTMTSGQLVSFLLYQISLTGTA